MDLNLKKKGFLGDFGEKMERRVKECKSQSTKIVCVYVCKDLAERCFGFSFVSDIFLVRLLTE